MNFELESQAIKAALNQNWTKAIELNKKIIRNKPKNIAALNRLGRAYWGLGDFEQADKTYQKVLQIDPFNPIASKNLQRLGKNKKKIKKNLKTDLTQSGKVFLEEPGKTKIVRLIRLTSPEVLSGIDSGEPVILLIKKRLVSVLDNNQIYLGSIPEDLSQRLIKFIKGGCQYECFVKNVECQKLEIFIREISRGKKFANLPSFPQGKFSLAQ